MPSSSSRNVPGLLRLIGSVLYDWLVLLGILMLAGFIAVGVNKALTGRDAIAPGNPLFMLWNLLIIYGYFAGFWLTKRQTVGMRAWRLHLAAESGPPTLKQCTLRFVAAAPAWGLVALGVLWRYTDRLRLGWHDRASGTHLVYTPKRKAKAN